MEAHAGHGAVIARWQKEIAAATTLVRTGQSQVHHPAEIGIIHGTQNARRNLQYHGTCIEIEAGEAIGRGGVGCEEQRARVHQVLGEAHALVLLDAGRCKAVAGSPDGGCRQALQEGFNGTAKVQLVEGELHRLRVRRAVLEMQLADAGLDLVRRQDGRRRISLELGGLCMG